MFENERRKGIFSGQTGTVMANALNSTK